MKKILLIGYAHSVHFKSLIKNISKKNITVDVLSLSADTNVKNDFHAKKILSSILLNKCISMFKGFEKFERFVYLRTAIISLVFNIAIITLFLQKKISRNYDMIQLHIVWPFYRHTIPLLRFFSKDVCGVFWGVDISHLSTLQLHSVSVAAKKCNTLSFISNDLYTKFIENCLGNIPNNRKRIARFGLSTLKKIDNLRLKRKEQLKMLLGIKNQKKIITIGYNGFENQQHKKIIESLPCKLVDNCFLIVPFTYGGEAKYLELVKMELQKSGFQYIIITKFLSNEENAALRLITDCFIQLQVMDVLSGAMQEHLYAGSYVVTGSWLPYDILYENGVEMDVIQSMETLPNALYRFIYNKPFSKEKNKRAIFALSSWENVIDDWIN